MASIRKRISKTGQVSYQAQIYTGRDSNGKQLFEYVTKDTRKECRSAAREIEEEIEKGTYIKIKNMLVVDAIKEWIELKRSELSPGTIHLYKNTYLKAHYKPFFKTLKLKDIVGNELLIRKFKSDMLKKQSPNTVRKELSVLNKILRETLRDKNPCKYVELPVKKKYTPRIPTKDEFLEIHAAVKGTVDEIIVLLAGWCALRLGEICAIKPDDVYKDRKIIRVDENLAINDEYDYEFKGPKSDNGIREVAVPDYLMQLIFDYMAKKGKISGKLFNYLPGSYSHHWKDIVTKKKLPKITFHSLRHHHLTWLWEEGFPDQYAANRAGHDIQTLRSIYQHLGLKKKDELDDSVRIKLPGSVISIEENKKRDSL